MNTKSTKIALAAAALTALAFTSTVQANETAEREISLHGYDLGNPGHVGKIKQRIHSAARTICELREFDDLTNRMAKRNCYEKAVFVAEAKVDARVAAWNSKNGTSVALDDPIKIVGEKR